MNFDLSIAFLDKVYYNIPMSRKKNETPQEDRRVQRTHQLLKEALLALIVEKGYEAINVQDITDRANIGRATFYLHYPDKEHLALACVEEAVAKLTAELDALPQEGELPDYAGLMVEQTFRHIGQNKHLYVSFLNSKSSYTMVMQIHDRVIETIGNSLKQQFAENSPPVPISLLTEHIAGSLLAMVKWWLNHDLPYPPEEIARLHMQLIGPGVLMLLQT